jgi:hypothetical protein
MKPDEIEELLVFADEIPMQQALFEESPLWIARIFLQCFDSESRQARGVPRHVLEALAKRLRMVMDGDTKSLDEAFGGSVRRQRNRLDELDRQYRIKQQPRNERSRGTPFEIALERVAKKLGMTAENVHRIYKAAGAR